MDDLRAFLDEAGELLEVLQTGFLRIEKGGRLQEDEALLHRLFRAAHSLKGMAGMVGLPKTQELTHAMEEVLDGLRNNAITAGPEVVDALFEAVDQLTTLIAALVAGEGENVEISDVVAALQSLLPAREKEQSSISLMVTEDIRSKLTEIDDINLFVAEQGGRRLFELRWRRPSTATAEYAEYFDLVVKRFDADAEVLAVVLLESAAPNIEIELGILLAADTDLDWQRIAGDGVISARDLSATPDAGINRVDRSQYLDLFLSESDEVIDGLNEGLLALEKDPFSPSINDLFRLVHRLKGESGAMGFDNISAVCHSTEDLLDALREGKMTAEPPIVSLLLESCDMLKNCLASLRDSRNSAPPIKIIIQKLHRTLKSGAMAADTETEFEPDQSPVVVPDAGATTSAASQTIRVELARLDGLLNLAGELVVAKARHQRLTTGLVSSLDVKHLLWLSEDSAQRTENMEGGAATAELVRGLADKIRQIRALSGDFELASHDLSRISIALQNAIMSTRMLPVGNVFRRFPRLVRDLVRQCNKQVRMEISGEDTELDKRVIDEIGDPLRHMIRNAIDHGFEPSEERALAGKNPTGLLELSAYREGSTVCIRLEDDGRGMDPVRIRKRAVEKNIISEGAELTREEILNLIFAPGFSTAATVTEVSGRGVGMDIVKSRIESLNGMVDISSELGVGSVIILRIPLTLAIVKALLVTTSGRTLAVPVDQIREIVRVDRGHVRTIEGAPMTVIRNRTIPLLDLASSLGFDVTDIWANGIPALPALIIETSRGAISFAVEKLLGEQEVVVKALPDDVSGVSGISGATILGDGSVALIVDALSLVARIESQRGVRM